MTSSWRGDRRIGPPPLVERLEVYWRPTLLALVATAVLLPFLLWIRFGWPPVLPPQNIAFLGCAIFAVMMVCAGQFAWQHRLWRVMAGLALTTCAIVLIVWFFAVPVASALGLVDLVPPVHP